MKNIIIDTGCANLFSVESAIKRLGYQVVISDDPKIISQADKVFLPGVGNARHAMENIRQKNLADTIKALKQPVLGFCLGMQLMAESSTEGIKPSTEGIKPSTEGIKPSTEGIKPSTEGIKPSTEGLKPSAESAVNEENKIKGLAVIPTTISPLQAEGKRLPHMGWNTLTSISDHPVFAGINPGDYFYFVHSFAAPKSEFTVASCEYGTTFSAAIAKDNFIGCQFHPERSGALGRKIIENFLEL
ncbi:imidazole glycerol phosphate synthase subunit HisH [Thalassomonas haliotis]|uniref:Imidazole glycerol phosphate synthase subunit HisH n=1 Tax=Thalassomonas haliotis TaxID=485448 RepID=A0ABY7VKS9_9GAMM|nr:imidazole glycerol phosphate synthase subunit HisH [Thalassomonas haliotis]WDE13646.1 imidazole glycerol phosphate synthase subunit HisH [Thalassomonas haliotis]